jgi:hypothetical protein
LSVAERAPSQMQHGTHSNPAAIGYVVEWLRARRELAKTELASV